MTIKKHVRRCGSTIYVCSWFSGIPNIKIFSFLKTFTWELQFRIFLQECW